jgi:hypothetical protein
MQNPIWLAMYSGNTVRRLHASRVAACGIFALTVTICTALAAQPTRIKIASSSVRENGCSETYQTFKIAIPHPEQLDRSYRGVLDGIEVVEREGNGDHSYGNFAFVDGGVALTYQLHARGAGTRIRNPFNNGSWCQGAAGANVTIDVYAHYKA